MISHKNEYQFVAVILRCQRLDRTFFGEITKEFLGNWRVGQGEVLPFGWSHLLNLNLPLSIS